MQSATSNELLPTQIVAPSVTTDQAVAAFRQFQELKKKLLTASDYQTIYMYEAGKGNVAKPFIKKSGWRKLATAFNVSCEVVKEERIEYASMEHKEKDETEKADKADKKKFTVVIKPGFVYRITARASAMNGRFMDGTGTCSSGERKFAHLEHDVRSTAETRAKNRAISDLIGGGEVSAEEVEEALEMQKEDCGTDHETMSERQVKSGKNKGRPYVRCGKCGFFEWRGEANEAGASQ